MEERRDGKVTNKKEKEQKSCGWVKRRNDFVKKTNKQKKKLKEKLTVGVIVIFDSYFIHYGM